MTVLFPFQPVPEELQNGPGFGYVVAFRPHGATGWMQAAVPSPEASRYVFKNESIQPFSPFHVKVGVYNNEGEGPFGPVITIYSAEEGPCGLVSYTMWATISTFCLHGGRSYRFIHFSFLKCNSSSSNSSVLMYWNVGEEDQKTLWTVKGSG